MAEPQKAYLADEDAAKVWLGHWIGDWVRLPDGMIALCTRRILRGVAVQDIHMVYDFPDGYEPDPAWRAESFVRIEPPTLMPREWAAWEAQREQDADKTPGAGAGDRQEREH